MEKKCDNRVWSVLDCLGKQEFFYNRKAARKRVLGLIRENNCQVSFTEKKYDDYGECIVDMQGGRGNGIRFFFQEHDNVEEIKEKGFTIL